MKYLKLFESFTELVNELTRNEIVEWLENHNKILYSEKDINMLREIVKKSRRLHISNIETSFYRSYIELRGNDSYIIVKYEDDWWYVLVIDVYDNHRESYYIIDGYEGLQKFFNEIE